MIMTLLDRGLIFTYYYISKFKRILIVQWGVTIEILSYIDRYKKKKNEFEKLYLLLIYF